MALTKVGPHIFVASAPSQIDSYDWQGFQAIGAGEETARNHLIWSEYDKNDPLDSVLYDVFNAKVATEVLQGVGYAWGLANPDCRTKTATDIKAY